jgi:uncharacterized caspase-like protein
MMRVLVLAWLAVVALALGEPANAERRVALVIGNGAYENAGTLANAPRDAAAMAALLTRVGFEVESVHDLNQRDLVQALRRFSRRADGADLALFFYAGHGVQANDVNYLLPVDANPERAEDLRYEGIDVTSVLSSMLGARARLLFLDACRNNPLADRLASRSRSVSRGLARIDTADAGTLISFATAPGMTADDGDAGNSPFTTALIEHLATPGLEIHTALTRVRNRVMAATGDRQVPWENSSLRTEIYVTPNAAEPVMAAAAPAATAPAAPAQPAPAAAPASDGLELRFWESAERGNSIAEYQAYLRRYPNGGFADLARARVAALEEARTAARSFATAQAASPTNAAPAAPPPAAAAAQQAQAAPPLEPPTFQLGPEPQAGQRPPSALPQSTAAAQQAAPVAPATPAPAPVPQPAPVTPPVAPAQAVPPPPVTAQVPAASAVAAIDRTLIAARPTIVRAAAGDAAPRVGQLAADATVEATGRTQVGAVAWYRVAFQGREGWVAAGAMREIDPAEVAAWSRVRGSREQQPYEDFLRAYPRGYFAERARRLASAGSANAPAPSPPPAANAPPQQVASRPPAGAGPRGCYRASRSGGNYVRFCFDGGSGRREESVSTEVQAGAFVSSSNTRHDLCQAPLTVAGGGEGLRVSWPAAACGPSSSSGGSTICSVSGDGAVLTCGSEAYRRD